MQPLPEPKQIPIQAIHHALRDGVSLFRRAPLLSVGYSGIFTLLGLIMFLLLEQWKLAPLSLSLAGGFMLIGPALLGGFFGVVRALDRGRSPGFRNVRDGFAQAPIGVWVVALFCLLLFLIWITDAAILYTFIVGHHPVGFSELLLPLAQVEHFLFFSSLMGLMLAFMLFAVSAFSVPLLLFHETTLIAAVISSTQAVFRNLLVMLLWALLLVLVIMSSAFLLPLLPLTLPVCAYASYRIYQRVYTEP